MTVLPQTTPVPDPVLIFMPEMSAPESGPPPPEPTSSSLPPSAPGTEDPPLEEGASGVSRPAFPAPKLRLEIRDLSHPGAALFLSSVNAAEVLSTAVGHVQRLLYRSPADHTTNLPPTRSVTVVLRDFSGVAYTTGSDLDSDHKEIHFSLGYVAGTAAGGRAGAEITGVLTHELVHCYQWNARGSCPGGLIEGIADWVRLCCDLSPPHWKRERDGTWDRGYQHTAYFLEYLETRFGEGTVRRINEKLRSELYQEKRFWTELLGRPVTLLWEDYLGVSKDGEDGNGSKTTVDEGTQT